MFGANSFPDPELLVPVNEDEYDEIEDEKDAGFVVEEEKGNDKEKERKEAMKRLREYRDLAFGTCSPPDSFLQLKAKKKRVYFNVYEMATTKSFPERWEL